MSNPSKTVADIHKEFDKEFAAARSKPAKAGKIKDFNAYMDERDKEMSKQEQDEYLRWWNESK